MSKAWDLMSSTSIGNGAHSLQVQLMSNGSYQVMVTQEGAGTLVSEAGGASPWSEKRIESILTKASGNGTAIGGIKVIAGSGLFAARSSGTEDMYKIYADSFRGAEHLQSIQQEAQAIVDLAIGPK